MARYSVCMLCFNDSKSLKRSLDSVLALSPSLSTEIIVVDNKSSDSSPEILHEYEKNGLITLIETKCSRGKGRQIALERSSGDYVLGHMDCDDVFSPQGISAWLEGYHRDHEGVMAMSKREHTDENSNITVAPRELFLKVGWRDLNWYEDWDLWNRAFSLKKYVFLKYPDQNPLHSSITVRVARRRGLVSRNVMTYGRYRDAYRIGRTVFRGDKRVPVGQRLIYSAAKIATDVRRAKLAPVEYPDFRY